MECACVGRDGRSNNHRTDGGSQRKGPTGLEPYAPGSCWRGWRSGCLNIIHHRRCLSIGIAIQAVSSTLLITNIDINVSYLSALYNKDSRAFDGKCQRDCKHILYRKQKTYEDVFPNLFARKVTCMVTYCHQMELPRVYKLWKAKATPRTLLIAPRERIL